MSLCRSAQRTYAGLIAGRVLERVPVEEPAGVLEGDLVDLLLGAAGVLELAPEQLRRLRPGGVGVRVVALPGDEVDPDLVRSEEHTSELQSLMRISYAVFCLKNKIKNKNRAH